MSEKITKMIDEIKELTVLALNELVKAIEEEFGVSAAAPVAVVAGGAAAGGEVHRGHGAGQQGGDRHAGHRRGPLRGADGGILAEGS